MAEIRSLTNTHDGDLHPLGATSNARCICVVGTVNMTGDCKETFWLDQRIGIAVRKGNVLSILEAVREKYNVELNHATASCLSSYTH